MGETLERVMSCRGLVKAVITRRRVGVVCGGCSVTSLCLGFASHLLRELIGTAVIVLAEFLLGDLGVTAELFQLSQVFVKALGPR